LRAAEIAKAERPKHRHLCHRDKYDPIDAEVAARAVLAGEAAGVVAGHLVAPRMRDGKRHPWPETDWLF
jgi:hypothetical protein